MVELVVLDEPAEDPAAVAVASHISSNPGELISYERSNRCRHQFEDLLYHIVRVFRLHGLADIPTHAADKDSTIARNCLCKDELRCSAGKGVLESQIAKAFYG